MKTTLLPLIAASCLFFTEAHAALIITFDGMITGFTSSGPLSGISVGDPFTVQVYYDLSPTASSNNGTYVNNVYVPPTSAAYWWFGEGYTMSATFGSYSIVTTDNTTFDVRNSDTALRGFAIYNAFSFASGNFATNGAGSLSVNLFSTPPSGHEFAESSLESVVEYPVADFDENAFRVLGTFNGISGNVSGQITSYHITSVPVPEPSTAVFTAIAALGLLFSRNRKLTPPTAAVSRATL
ncbi:MAG: hypothetical protein R3F13_16525 [Prosthecobacter sp.]